MNLRVAILCLLYASCGAFAQVPLATPVPTPSNLSTARSIIQRLVFEIEEGQKKTAVLSQQFEGTKEVLLDTQKVNLETQKQINNLSEFAKKAQSELLEATVERDQARMEAHQNAKERDVFLFTISAMITIFVLTSIKGVLQAISNPWLEIGFWIVSLLGTFGISYVACRYIVKLFAQMIP